MAPDVQGSQTKECAICGQAVERDLIACPKCGGGAFAVAKTHATSSAQVPPPVNRVVKTFGPDKLIKDHLSRVTKAWPQDRAANWARQLVQRVVQRQLDTISLLADGKMSESLSDGERHSTGMWVDDVAISISTFPCSVPEARRTHYAAGYLTYLDRMVAIVRQENPRCHWLHFQFFWDGASFWVQFTLFPNKNVLDFAPMYHFPTDVLSDEEKRKVGLG